MKLASYTAGIDPAALAKTRVSSGANVTIVCGTIGRYVLIGARTVVTRDFPVYALIAGNPTRQCWWTCVCGIKLNARLQCDACGPRFEE